MNPVQLDDVQLGPVRVISQRRIRQPAPLARSWDQVRERAARPPSVLKKTLRAEYDAGQVSRTTAMWGAPASNANRAIQFNLSTLRGRARDLERNDPYAKHFLSLVETNVVGSNGVAMQSKITEPGPNGKLIADNIANTIIEREWARFSRPGEFDVTGRLGRAAFERLFIRSVARDGEVLVKKVTDPSARYGIRFQILESDWLDETMNEDRPDGSRVIMGVELNASGRDVAYWLRARHPGDSIGKGTAARIRYTADEMKLYFLPLRAEQVRGVPWMHAAMSRLYQLGEFDESAIIAARIGADKSMLLEDPEGMVAEMADGALPGADGTTDIDDSRSGALFFNSQKGSIDILPKGAKVAQYDPNYPSDAYGPFVLATLRGIASGLGTSYESLSNDRSGVTWTSIRHAVLDERDGWKVVQDWLIDSLSHDLFSAWLRVALIAPFRPLGFLPAAKIDKFDAPHFQGRRWDWVNPKDDLDAKRGAIEARLTSHRRVLAEQGVDLEDLFAEIQQDRELAAQYGIDLDVSVAKTAAGKTAATQDQEMEDDDEEVV